MKPAMTVQEKDKREATASLAPEGLFLLLLLLLRTIFSCCRKVFSRLTGMAMIVPKFGNWEEKDIPYTKYFEDALKTRVAGFNPNDPEDNPEADTRNRPAVMQQRTSSQTTDRHARRSSTLAMNRDASLQRTSSKKFCCFFPRSQE